MAERVVRGACPHDCPDGCAMLVTVDDAGRATHVAGDPEHPITAGFLCGKVSNYLDRVYADDRLLEPLVRNGPKGAGRFRPASWDEALDLVVRRLRDAIAARGGETVLPYFYMGTMGMLQHHSMSARFFHALGASDLVRTICASAGSAGVAADPRHLAGGRSRALAEGALHPVLGLESDVDRAAPVAADPRRPPRRREARGRRPVPQPHRARGRRAPAARARARTPRSGWG